MTASPKHVAEHAGLTMPDARDRLRRLERQDWSRWLTVATITLLLSFAVFALSLPVLKRDLLDQTRLELAVTALVGLVLLFNLFAMYQQWTIVRLRRQLATQIGMVATLEMLKPAEQPDLSSPGPQRYFQRFHFDQRLTIKAKVNGRDIAIHGRTSDISDGGVGAVIPDPLELGTQVLLEVNLGALEPKLVTPAVLRYRRGFHHGFEFSSITPEQLDSVRRACDGALPFFDFRATLKAGASNRGQSQR